MLLAAFTSKSKDEVLGFPLNTRTKAFVTTTTLSSFSYILLVALNISPFYRAISNSV